MDTTSDGRAAIVKEIMNNLYPWKRRKSEVREVIHEVIECLATIIPLEASLFDRGAIKNSAQEFGAAIAEVERLLHDMPGQARRLLFADPLPTLSDDNFIWWLLGEPPPKISNEEFEEMGFHMNFALDNYSKDDILRSYVHRMWDDPRLTDFNKELRRLRTECKKLVRTPPAGIRMRIKPKAPVLGGLIG